MTIRTNTFKKILALSNKEALAGNKEKAALLIELLQKYA